MKRPFLRDRGDDSSWRVRLAAAEVEAEAARASGDAAALCRALQRAGEAARFLGDYDGAVRRQEEAARAAPDVALSRTTRLALATALQYRDEHERAATLFRALLDEIRAADDGSLQDYVLQHFGKCLAEMGEIEQAIACFEQALRLREARGPEAAELVESSRLALETARRWQAGA